MLLALRLGQWGGAYTASVADAVLGSDSGFAAAVLTAWTVADIAVSGGAVTIALTLDPRYVAATWPVNFTASAPSAAFVASVPPTSFVVTG